MENESLHEESKPKQDGIEEQKISADDLKFMRSAVEKTYKQVNPDTHTMIMWGVICLISYPAIHFLVKNQLFKWIWVVFLLLSFHRLPVCPGPCSECRDRH